MQTTLSIAITITLLSAIYVFLVYGSKKCQGQNPVSTFALMAILFTSGLDVGLVMFPLTEFPTYASEKVYSFTNPLAIEFGFWGFLVWGFYFLTTVYFVLLEPKLKFFEIPLIKIINNIVIITTCAFTAYLFLSYLPTYIKNIGQEAKYVLVATVVLIAVFSSTDIKYVKVLSIASTWLFFSLIIAMWLFSENVLDLFPTIGQISGYFTNIHQFVTPISDYHAFYLFWWFSWSIMIGQFIARFTNGISVWKLCFFMLVIPSIPLAIWFSVLYLYYTHGVDVGAFKGCMVVVGIIFVAKSRIF